MVAHALQENVKVLKDKGQESHLLRDTVIFLAGVSAFHTLSHVWLGMSDLLPMSVPLMPSFTITQSVNGVIILASALITVGLLYWAHRLKK
jgi:hypothetical protein